MDGIIIIDKEKDFTSHDVVAKLRGILRQKKIGHTGTLDPDATGVLPVCLGKATKVCDMLTDTDKCYETTFLLGVETDTQDMSGEILKQCEPVMDEARIREAVESFLGDYDQIPPMYSALKVNGQKLCDLAREGKEVERKSRRIRIHAIEILAMDLPRVTMRVSCSKGTYIRTLCHDIGQKLGCGAAVEELRRTRVGVFDEGQAITLAQVEELRDRGEIEERLIPLEVMFCELPSFTVSAEYDKALSNGNKLKLAWGEKDRRIEEACTVHFSDGRFAAVYEWNEEMRMLKPRKMFL